MSNRQIGTRHKLAVLEFIDEHVRTEGVPPTVRDIGSALNLSPSTVHKHIEELEADGKIMRKGARRLLTLVTEDGKMSLRLTLYLVAFWGWVVTGAAALDGTASLWWGIGALIGTIVMAVAVLNEANR